MNESSMGELRFNDNLPSDRLYRDRFVFPGGLTGLFIDTDAIVEAMEMEMKKRIKEKTINNFSNEVILKNITGPYYNDLDEDEKKSLINVIEAMRNDLLKADEEKPMSDNNQRKIFTPNAIQEAIAGAVQFAEKEALRAGDTEEVIRNGKGEIDVVGDTTRLEGRILELEDAEE